MKIQNIKNKVNTYFTKGNERSLMAKRNIVASLVMKGIIITFRNFINFAL